MARRHNLTRHDLGDTDVRRDVSRSVDGVQRFRYSIRSNVQLPETRRTNDSDAILSARAQVTFRTLKAAAETAEDSSVRYFELEPEVPGALGEGTAMELRRDAYPLVTRPQFEWSLGYLGDDLLTTHPVYFVTTPLAESLQTSGLSGFHVSRDFDVTVHEQLPDVRPGWTPPSIVWLNVTGDAGSDDFGLSATAGLIVSDAALALLRTHRLEHCEVTAVE